MTPHPSEFALPSFQCPAVFRVHVGMSGPRIWGGGSQNLPYGLSTLLLSKDLGPFFEGYILIIMDLVFEKVGTFMSLFIMT